MIKTLFQSTRPPFLVLTPICIFLGVCTVLVTNVEVSTIDVGLILLGALCAHISANTFNEYFDYKSGLDSITQRTPFSGGSGALPNDPNQLLGVWLLSLLTVVITIVVGIYFVISVGLGILPFGLIGIAILVSYTPWINQRPWVCLIAPGISFGPLMVIGTHYALTGNISLLSVLASLIPFFLVNNLLLLNQYPDIHADRSVGRRHFSIVYGVKNSTKMYIGFVIAAILGFSATIVFQKMTAFAYLGLISLIPAMFAIYGAHRYADNIQKLTPYLAANTSSALFTPLALGITLLINFVV